MSEADRLPVLRSRTTPALPQQVAVERDDMLSVELRKAQVLAKAGDAVPRQYRGNQGAILLAMDWGAKRGLDILTALQSVSFIDGKPTVDATMLRALAPRAGYRIIVETADNAHAVVAVRDFNTGELVGRSTFTFDDAKAAGLTGKQNWKTYTEDMLVARATSRAMRRYAPEVMVGLAVPDEVDGGGAGFSVDAQDVQVPSPSPVGPGLDNGGGSATGTDPGPPVSDTELEARAVLRGTVGAVIDQLDDDQRKRLRAWMKGKGWTLAGANSDDLAIVLSYAQAMVTPDDPDEVEVDPNQTVLLEVDD